MARAGDWRAARCGPAADASGGLRVHRSEPFEHQRGCHRHRGAAPEGLGRRGGTPLEGGGGGGKGLRGGGRVGEPWPLKTF